jgi:8-oxo-dGTP diphosphatase
LSDYIPSSPEEAEFLANYNPTKYGPGVGYTADTVVLTIRNGKLAVLLIKRGGFPYKDHWALPGGFVNHDESADEGAVRELVEETGISIDKVYIEQLKTYSTPGRDPRMRIISTAYIAFIPDLPTPVGGDDAAEAHFFAIEDLFDDEENINLAFDHELIIRDALERAASKLEYTPLAAVFLEEQFTLSDLRRVYEAVWGESLHAANFRRKVLSTTGFVVPVGTKGESKFDTGRTADLYESGNLSMLHPAILRTSLKS